MNWLTRICARYLSKQNQGNRKLIKERARQIRRELGLAPLRALK